MYWIPLGVRRPLTRRRFLQGAAAAGAVAAASPRVSWSADSKVLRVRQHGDFQVLDPANRLSSDEDNIMGAIFEKLIEFRTDTDNWDWKLQAATSIEQVDPVTVKFAMRPGMVWSKGFGEVTTEDVKYSFERIAGITDPSFESAYRVDWASLKEVQVVDKLNGVIHLKEPFAPLWTSSLPYGSGNIICKKATEAVGGKFTTEPPATYGPYVIKEWVPEQKTVLARNPDYNGEKPYFDEIHVFQIEDDKAAEVAYEAGELDITEVSISSLPRYREKMPEGSKLSERQPLAYIWLGINTGNPQFEDIRIRKAVQLAVDGDAVLEAAFYGAAKRSTGIIAPGLIGHREKNLVDKRDLDKARALLAEAGVGDGFKCTLQIFNRTDHVSAAQVIQANLAEIGIEVEIIPLDSGTFWTLGFKETPGHMDIQLILNRYTMAPDPSWATEWFTQEQIGVWNWERFDNKEFSDLHKAAVIELDQAKRQAMYVKMQDLMEESGAYVFLTHGVLGFIYKEDIVPGLRLDGQNFIFRNFTRA